MREIKLLVFLSLITLHSPLVIAQNNPNPLPNRKSVGHVNPEKSGVLEMKETLKNFSKVNTPLICSLNDEINYVCDSMSTLSCKPGTFDDGTGKSLSESDYNAKVDPMKMKVKGYYQATFLKMLKDPNPKYNLVREMALKATLQDGTPDCTSTKIAELNQCYSNVANNLSDMQMKMEFGTFNRMNDKSMIDFEAYSTLTNNQAFKNAITKPHQQSVEVVTDNKLSQNIEKNIFPKVKKILIEKIKVNIKDEKICASIIKKIENISYNGNDCSGMGFGSMSSEASVSGLMVDNAFYSSSTQSFKFCNGYLLKNSSDFAIAEVIGHELSHSIDPCSITLPEGFAPVTYSRKKKIEDYESQYPFQDLIGCLRSTESVAAMPNNSPYAIGSLEDYPFNPFCSYDQITESFSDWMGAEILPEYISKYHPTLSQNQKIIGYSNVFRGSCAFGDNPYDPHPANDKRIDRILMANRDSRKLLGCGESKKNLHYCQTGDGFKGTRVAKPIIKTSTTTETSTTTSGSGEGKTP